MTAADQPTPRVGDAITVRRPHVENGPVGVPADKADADYLRSAVRNIEHRMSAVRGLWGSGVTAMVVQLLTDAADAIEHPAPVDEDAVERAARAMWMRQWENPTLHSWAAQSDDVRAPYRLDARAALAAAHAGEAEQ